MRKFLLLGSMLIAALSLNSCSDDNDGVYLSNSGNGSLVVGYSAPDYLYRMVFFNSLSAQELYLMGNSAYVSADGNFAGRGAVVKITMPADAETVTQILQAQSFEIDQDDYTASYSTYVNYSSDRGEDSFIPLTSGTVVIRRSGQYYDLRLLATDEDSHSVIISYSGYIYRWFYDDQEDTDDLRARE